ncbi:DUF512 domain-containing protein [Sporosalibacterium faouarense]|uniref:DUF512 domain-containing protein n=1 Tax=Sporosalibacterium faouarense TaxID=516123 RepID=UPI00141CE82E|nr:DUF512 domain-containing protein [Sporosalibacterium faouarense]MTI47765.1 DUF512 domain-containing protein [Bacillota bacterium]
MELNNYEEIRNIIESVEKDSIAEELGVEKGDILVDIDGQEVKDVIDYKFFMSDDFVTVTIEKSNGELWELEIEKEYHEDIGIVFTNPLIDKAKRCQNKCIFCFIDQLPKNMRHTLYFKDDDSRLSFLQGNFITLTNMSDDEIDRIIRYRLSPINISVHTTDPELRVKMMKNKRAGRIIEILRRFNEVGIEMNCQIVLVPGINDGENLNRTLRDLIELYPNVVSAAVVPIGVTKYREGLFEAETYDYNKSLELLDQVHEFQRDSLSEKNTRFIFAADEFYVLANKEVPNYEAYEGFPQLENGIGLMRKFLMEIEEVLDNNKASLKNRKKYGIATGTLANDFMNDISSMIMNKFNKLDLKVVPIKNTYFGETITVSGLVTGNDLIRQFKECEDFEELDGIIIPRAMLKANDEIFLDDVTVRDVEEKLQKKVLISEVDGKSFIDIFIKDNK